jgi:uncharacterized phiE125 gp8 family phage protein
MTLVVVTPPEPLIDIDEAKRFLNVEDNDQDALIGTLIVAAQGAIDGPDGWLGRCIGVQTLQLSDPCVDCWGKITLPCPPVIGIVSVTYADGRQTADPSSYALGPGNVLRPTRGFRWPWGRLGRLDHDSRAHGVTVQYRAGYETLPAPIRAAILLMVSDLFYTRGGQVDGSQIANPAIERLLSPYHERRV